MTRELAAPRRDEVADPSRLSVVFMGSPDFAVPTLRTLARHHDVRAVVSQPDRKRGRGRALAPPPVKRAALELGLPVLQPVKLRSRAVREQIMGFTPDVIVVVAYGQILSPRLLAGPPLGCINVHASLLPALRGAAPIQWAVLEGHARSGVSIMRMSRGLDTGPVLLSQSIELAADETAGSLHDRLAPLGATLLLRALAGFARGDLEASEQDDAAASYARMLSKDDGRVDFSRSAREVDCWIRGMDPWPGAYADHAGERLKLFRSALGQGQGGAAPGTVLGRDERGLLVACAEGEAVFVGDLQLAGRRRMAASALLAGYEIADGAVLG
ncbi:MAG: methionyl-tRNA formyltransferase [Myxococcales bacterium]|nr:methionyl-tRNA formyltransferase [Myxococcales bacterium]